MFRLDVLFFLNSQIFATMLSFGSGAVDAEGNLRKEYVFATGIGANAIAAQDDDGESDTESSSASDSGSVDSVDLPAPSDSAYQSPAGPYTRQAGTAAPAAPAAVSALSPVVAAWFDKIKSGPLGLDAASVVFDKADALGAGHFGTVAAARFKRGGGAAVRVAVKTLKSAVQLATQQDRDEFAVRQADFVHELKIMKRLGKHCAADALVTRLLGVFESAGVLNAVLDFALVGSLDTLVLKSKRAPGAAELSEHDKFNVAYQLARGLAACHAARIIHNDVATRNALAYFDPAAMEKGLVVKICDFGLSLKLPAGKKLVTGDSKRPCPWRWSPIESLLFDPRCYLEISDVYMFACTVFEIFEGEVPHRDLADDESAKYVQEMLHNGRSVGVPAAVEKAGLGALMKRAQANGPLEKGKELQSVVAMRPQLSEIVTALSKWA